jgi:succinate dehydrogenase / fumarate reductase cytochrome b subunit
VLSITHRISGVLTSLAAVGLVLWLLAAAAGPQTYSAAQDALASPLGQVGLFVATFAFFLHLCGGIRHLAWDAGYGFELSAIYASGWTVVGASVGLTAAVWLTAR